MITDNIAKATNWNIYSEIKTGALGGSTWHRKSTCSMASSVNMLFFGIVCLIACTLCRAADDDKCQSFAGGSVFPQETRRTSGHAIQWSQAVSKFCIQRASFPVLGLSWNLITVYESHAVSVIDIYGIIFICRKFLFWGVFSRAVPMPFWDISFFTYCSVDMYSTLQFYQTCSFVTERSIRDFLLYFL